MVTSRKSIGQVGGLPGHPDLVQRCSGKRDFVSEHLAKACHRPGARCATSSAFRLMTRADVASSATGSVLANSIHVPKRSRMSTEVPHQPGKTCGRCLAPDGEIGDGKVNAHRLADINEDLVQARVVQN